MMSEPEVSARISRIVEFLDYGNFYGARWFLQKLIDDSVGDGNLGGDVGIDWAAMYQRELQNGIGHASGETK